MKFLRLVQGSFVLFVLFAVSGCSLRFSNLHPTVTDPAQAKPSAFRHGITTEISLQGMKMTDNAPQTLRTFRDPDYGPVVISSRLLTYVVEVSAGYAVGSEHLQLEPGFSYGHRHSVFPTATTGFNAPPFDRKYTVGFDNGNVLEPLLGMNAIFGKKNQPWYVHVAVGRPITTLTWARQVNVQNSSAGYSFDTVLDEETKQKTHGLSGRVVLVRDEFGVMYTFQRFTPNIGGMRPMVVQTHSLAFVLKPKE